MKVPYHWRQDSERSAFGFGFLEKADGAERC